MSEVSNKLFVVDFLKTVQRARPNQTVKANLHKFVENVFAAKNRETYLEAVNCLIVSENSFEQNLSAGLFAKLLAFNAMCISEVDVIYPRPAAAKPLAPSMDPDTNHPLIDLMKWCGITGGSFKRGLLVNTRFTRGENWKQFRFSSAVTQGTINQILTDVRNAVNPKKVRVLALKNNYGIQGFKVQLIS